MYHSSLLIRNSLKMNSLHFYRHNNKNRNILSNAAYFTANVKDPEYKCLNYNLHENNYLQRSFSADNVVIHSRGFKPSDIHDPAKRHFLENLTTKILHVDMEGGETRRIDLQKLLTPANDYSEELLHVKNKKMYASSYFYAPSHPTVEDQVELARRISHSLSDVKNLKSKGQSMYVNRKKRSVKWIHDGNGVESDDDSETTQPTRKDKIPLKCMMNPNGKVLDIHGIQALGEEVNIEERPSHPEKLFDIVRDLNNQKGRGAEIFAKRRKRSEKWVVEKDQSQTSTQPPSGIPWKAPYTAPNLRNKQEADVKENSALPPVELSPIVAPLTYAGNASANNTCRPFYNPFTLDLSLDPTSAPATGHGNGYMRYPRDVGNYNGTGAGKMKDIRVRAEVGVDHEPVDLLPFVERGKKLSSVVQAEDCAKKSKKKSGVKRKTIEYHPVDDPRSTCNRNKSYKTPDRSMFYHDTYDGEMIFNPGPSRNLHGHNGNRNYGNNNDTDSDDDDNNDNNDDDDDDDKDECDQCGDGVDSEYTPIPVKQLIQEFEKTCRPVMQYKQIDPSKIAPQLCTLDNDMISRYFEGRTYVSSAKNDEDTEQVNNNWNVNVRIPIAEEQLVTYDCNHEPVPDLRFSISRGVQRDNNVPGDSRQRDWRLKYIDDEDTSSTDDSTETSESPTRSLSTLEENEAYYRHREFVVPEFAQNGDCPAQMNGKVNNTSAGRQNQVPVDSHDKSLILAMVASEDDILQTIKQLRRTPVLSNLIPANGSPESCRFGDILPEVGNKLYENNEYQGPKLNSYQKLSNYNTAPRGWDQAHTYYRPITFGRPQEAIVYSDF